MVVEPRAHWIRGLGIAGPAAALVLAGCGSKSEHDRAVDAVRDLLKPQNVIHSVACHRPYPLQPHRWECRARIDDPNPTGRIVDKPCHVDIDGDHPAAAACGPG